MTSTTFVLLSGTLTFGVPLVLAIRELLAVGPSPGGGEEPPPEPRLRPAPRPLPDCLLPKPVVVRVRRATAVLEDA